MRVRTLATIKQRDDLPTWGDDADPYVTLVAYEVVLVVDALPDPLPSPADAARGAVAAAAVGGVMSAPALVTTDVRQNTDEWLAMRRTGVTASEMPVVMGNRPGLVELWAYKSGLVGARTPIRPPRSCSTSGTRWSRSSRTSTPARPGAPSVASPG